MKTVIERISMFSLDHESGSSELAVQAVEILDAVAGKFDDDRDAHAAVRTAATVFLAQPSIAPVLTAVNRFALFVQDAGGKGASLRKAWREWATGRQKKLEFAAAHGAEAIGRAQQSPRVVTFSYSSLVIRALVARSRAGEQLSVTVGESRPLLEGRKTASRLAEAGIPVALCVDAALFGHLERANLVVIGADGIYGGRVVSKIGSAPLLTLGSDHGAKIVVVGAEEKIVPRGLETFLRFPSHDRDEIFPGAPEGLVVENRYFDMTDIRMVDWLSTETGVYCGADVRGDINNLPVSAMLVDVLEKQEA